MKKLKQVNSMDSMDSVDFVTCTLMICCCFSDLSWLWFGGWMIFTYGIKLVDYIRNKN